MTKWRPLLFRAVFTPQSLQEERPRVGEGDSVSEHLTSVCCAQGVTRCFHVGQNYPDERTRGSQHVNLTNILEKGQKFTHFGGERVLNVVAPKHQKPHKY